MFHSLSTKDATALQTMQNKGLRIVTFSNRWASTDEMHSNTGMLRLTQGRDLHLLQFMHKCIKGKVPQYISNLLVPLSETHEHNTRGAEQGGFELPLLRTSMGQRGFMYAGPALWNLLSPEVKSHQHKGKSTFKKYASTWVLENR